MGVDFSDASRRALDHAIPLCVKLDAELLLLHAWNPTGWVLEPEMAEGGEGWLDAAQELARARLEDWGEHARQAGARVETRLEAGAASLSITETASTQEAMFVVVGRRGHARLAHVLLGSVSERVVHLARGAADREDRGSRPQARGSPRPSRPPQHRYARRRHLLSTPLAAKCGSSARLASASSTWRGCRGTEDVPPDRFHPWPKKCFRNRPAERRPSRPAGHHPGRTLDLNQES